MAPYISYFYLTIIEKELSSNEIFTWFISTPTKIGANFKILHSSMFDSRFGTVRLGHKGGFQQACAGLAKGGLLQGLCGFQRGNVGLCVLCGVHGQTFGWILSWGPYYVIQLSGVAGKSDCTWHIIRYMSNEDPHVSLYRPLYLFTCV